MSSGGLTISDRFRKGLCDQSQTTADEVIVELLANAWDAGATKVNIAWPINLGGSKHDNHFVFEDDGAGMSEADFLRIWPQLEYDRVEDKGRFAESTQGHVTLPKPYRRALARDGMGRFRIFALCAAIDAKAYTVESRRDERYFKYKVESTNTAPMILTKVAAGYSSITNHGTIIAIGGQFESIRTADDIMEIVARRFLLDPTLVVSVNGQRVTHKHVSKEYSYTTRLKTSDGEPIEVVMIDGGVRRGLNKQGGIAWHIRGELVGLIDWKHLEIDKIFSGRHDARQRYTAIVRADCFASALNDTKSELVFDNKPILRQAADQVFAAIFRQIDYWHKEHRATLTETAFRDHGTAISHAFAARLSMFWDEFVCELQERAPSIRAEDLRVFADMLTKLEGSESKYALIKALGQSEGKTLDALERVFERWSVDSALEILDEVNFRLQLIEKLRTQIGSGETREVQDLQPLFEKCLWILGPEYESIEYTSNQTMTNVIAKFPNASLHEGIVASSNRPDFVVFPDSTVGFYSCDRPGADDDIVCCERLLIIELKKPGVTIAASAKNQAWQYASELLEKEVIDSRTMVKCYVFGSKVSMAEREPRTERGGRVVISAFTYDQVLRTAEKRMQFLRKHISERIELEHA